MVRQNPTWYHFGILKVVTLRTGDSSETCPSKEHNGRTLFWYVAVSTAKAETEPKSRGLYRERELESYAARWYRWCKPPSRGHEMIFPGQSVSLLAEAGVASVKLPPRSPNLNAHAERFVRTIKESCLERMVLFGESAVRKATAEFIAHYHKERNHQGLANALICPEPQHPGGEGELHRRERLGGLLNYYYRKAA